jgi:hypothetical protein
LFGEGQIIPLFEGGLFVTLLENSIYPQTNLLFTPGWSGVDKPGLGYLSWPYDLVLPSLGLDGKDERLR